MKRKKEEEEENMYNQNTLVQIQILAFEWKIPTLVKQKCSWQTYQNETN